MKLLTSAAVAAFLVMGGSFAHAGCMPLNSDVVSLGKKSARSYSERSLAAAIAGERDRLKSAGITPAKVTKAVDCKPYPNLIGADEWRCVGEAKVCSK